MGRKQQRETTFTPLPLPPSIDKRVLDTLVEKKVIAASNQSKWEPRHAMCSDTDFLLSRPTTHQSIEKLRQVLTVCVLSAMRVRLESITKNPLPLSPCGGTQELELRVDSCDSTRLVTVD